MTTTGTLRAVVFDYGHTLVDFALAEDALLECYGAIRKMLALKAARELPAEQTLIEALTRTIERIVVQSYESAQLEELDIVDLFDSGLRALGASLPRSTVQKIAEMEHRALLSRLSISRENLQVLCDLRASTLKIGVVSNAHYLPSLMREDLERLKIMQYVDAAVFSAEIGVRKPNPAIFLKVLRALDVKPQHAIFVGDRVRDDIGGASRLGMRTVLTRQYRCEDLAGSAHPDRVIDRLPDLVPYVRELLEAQSKEKLPVSDPLTGRV